MVYIIEYSLWCKILYKSCFLDLEWIKIIYINSNGKNCFDFRTNRFSNSLLERIIVENRGLTESHKIFVNTFDTLPNILLKILFLKLHLMHNLMGAINSCTKYIKTVLNFLPWSLQHNPISDCNSIKNTLSQVNHLV